jgi:Zn-dependent peptidase ImmA (M78 family)
VYTGGAVNRGRDRFTLAHELAHHLLDHGRYLVRESCDDNDFVLRRSAAIDGSDVARMEFQANYLAASLLMPRTHVTEDFHRLVRTLEIADKGFGPLYVDNQPCNLQNFAAVTGRLMQKYGVSRAAAKIRLESMGLLRDERGRHGPRSIQDVLAARHDD